MPRDKLTFTIIVPVQSGGEKFRRCLQSIEILDPHPNEIIVVSNGDTDGSATLAEKSGAHVLRYEHSLGPAKARNLGAKIASSDIIVFIDADVLVQIDLLQRIRRVFKKNPQLSAVFGSYDQFPTEQNFLSQYRNLLHHYVHQNSSKYASTFWGACGAIYRDVFLSMGGFDERYTSASIEDIELGYRLIQDGYQIILDKGLQVTHQKHWGVISLLKTDILYRAIPWAKLIIRTRNFANDLNTDRASRYSILCSFGLLASLLLLTTPWSLLLSGLFLLSIIWLNNRLYLFFAVRRGTIFAFFAFLWHFLYFIYSGLSLGIALVTLPITELFLTQKAPTR